MTLSGIVVHWLFIPPFSFMAAWKCRRFVFQGRWYNQKTFFPWAIGSLQIYADYFIRGGFGFPLLKLTRYLKLGMQ